MSHSHAHAHSEDHAHRLQEQKSQDADLLAAVKAAADGAEIIASSPRRRLVAARLVPASTAGLTGFCTGGREHEGLR